MMGQVERARALLQCDAGPEGVTIQRPAKRGGSWRALAHERAARGIVPRISYKTVRCALKKRTDALASGATRLSAGPRGGLRGPDGSSAGSALRCALSGDRQGPPELSVLTQ